MTRSEFQAVTRKIDRNQVKESGGTFNAFLMNMYKHQTGQHDFRTFKAWKEAGFQVMKGSSSFAIFSRPIGVIKTEQGKEVSESEFSHFGVCHLFHAGQVQPIEGAKIHDKEAEQYVNDLNREYAAKMEEKAASFAAMQLRDHETVNSFD